MPASITGRGDQYMTLVTHTGDFDHIFQRKITVRLIREITTNCRMNLGNSMETREEEHGSR
jgi:hypothetical protein